MSDGHALGCICARCEARDNVETACGALAVAVLCLRMSHDPELGDACCLIERLHYALEDARRDVQRLCPREAAHA